MTIDPPLEEITTEVVETKWKGVNGYTQVIRSTLIPGVNRAKAL